MKCIKALKAVFKAAVHSGKIVYIGPKNQHDDILYFDVSKYDNYKKWKDFELNELKLRQSLASSKYGIGTFVCKGDYLLWSRVIKIICGTFYKDGRFSYKNFDKDWPPSFIKYCFRIVKTLPTENNRDNNRNNVNMLQKLEHQLSFIKNTIQPYFSYKSVHHNND